MMCRNHWNQHVRVVMLLLGAVSLLTGLLSFLIVQPEGQSINTFLGMLTGFGAGILAVAVYKSVREKIVSKEQLEQERIEQEDERSIAIGRITASLGFYTAFGMLCVLIFLFMLLDYRMPSYICLGCLYVLAAVVAIARKVVSRKM